VSMPAAPRADFWRGKRVMLTGHTGFKGAWMALRLQQLGALVTGFALAPDSRPNLFDLLAPWSGLASEVGDIREADAIRRAVGACDPEIVVHMAAQSLVRRSYRQPAETFAVNVLGTLNLLAALGRRPRVVLVVTSDKVYDNQETGRPHGEGDPLGGDDPYSASKAATELAVHSWRQSFAPAGKPALATARAGNVIGGGDWAEDRLVPDVVRAAAAGRPVVLRYPAAVRPWQHVLDVVDAYLLYAERLAGDGAVPAALNFGPLDPEPLPAAKLVERLQRALQRNEGWQQASAKAPPEKQYLALDVGLAMRTLDWRPRLAVAEALDWTAGWYADYLRGADMRAVSAAQIERFAGLAA